mgnify:FL=1
MTKHKFIREIHGPHGSHMTIETMGHCDDKCLIELFTTTIRYIRKGDFLIVDISKDENSTV